MAESSKGKGIVTKPVRVSDDAGAIEGRRVYREDFGQRTAGMKPGTYVVRCDWCNGVGNVRIANLPFERCIKCEGVGNLIINGSRQGDQEKRLAHDHDHSENHPIMGAIGLILLVTAGLFVWAFLTHRLPL